MHNPIYLSHHPVNRENSEDQSTSVFIEGNSFQEVPVERSPSREVHLDCTKPNCGLSSLLGNPYHCFTSLPSTVPPENVNYDRCSVFEDLVNRIEAFLLKSFLTHPVLVTLLVSPPTGSYTISSGQGCNWEEAPQQSFSTLNIPESARCTSLSYFSASMNPPKTPESTTLSGSKPVDVTASISAVSEKEQLEPFGDSSVVITKDFPIFLYRTSFFGPLSSSCATPILPNTAGVKAPNAHPPMMRVEIHYQDKVHDIARTHCVPLFLLGYLLPGQDEKNSKSNSFHPLGFSIGEKDGEEFAEREARYRLRQSFPLSVLLAAANNVFSPGARLELDLQRVFNLSLSPTNVASLFYPAPRLRAFGSFQLASVFPLSASAVPCFSPIDFKAPPSSLAQVASANFLLSPLSEKWNRHKFYGVSSNYALLSHHHRICIQSVLSNATRSPDILSSPTKQFITEFIDLLPRTSSGLPSFYFPTVIGKNSSNSTTAIKRNEFERGEEEMLQYLLDIFRYQMGLKSLRRGSRYGTLSSFSSLLEMMEPRASNSINYGSSAEAPVMDRKENTSCCISLQKRFRLVFRSSFFTWKEYCNKLNQIFRTRFGATTYSVGTSQCPVESVTFFFQWNQLEEEEALYPEAVNPFRCVLSTSAESKKNTNPRVLSRVAEKCTIKARTLLQKNVETVATTSIQPIIGRFLSILRLFIKQHSSSPKHIGDNNQASAASLGEFSNGSSSHLQNVIQLVVRRVMATQSISPAKQLAWVHNLVRQESTADGESHRRAVHESKDEEENDIFTVLSRIRLTSAIPSVDADVRRCFLVPPIGVFNTRLGERAVDVDGTASSGHSTGKCKLQFKRRSNLFLPERTSHSYTSVKDIRVGYLPGSFLCRLAFYLGEVVTAYEPASGVILVSSIWLSCISELEKLLRSTESQSPLDKRKTFHELLGIIGLPLHTGNGDNEFVDHTQSLLVQKFQYLAYCIRVLLQRTENETNEEHRKQMTEMQANFVPSISCSARVGDELHPLKEGEKKNLCSEYLPLNQCQSNGERIDPIDVENTVETSALTLITNGEPIIIPPSIPAPPTTSDVYLTQNAFSSSISDINLIPFKRLCNFSVFNDMCLFRYVNRSRVVRFPDFVQWVSPVDFRHPIRPSADDNDYLSTRMKIPVNKERSVSCERSEVLSAADNLMLNFPEFSSAEAMNTLQDPQTTEGDDGLPNEKSSLVNIWWALWERAVPRSPAQVIEDGINYHEESLELLVWMRDTVTLGILCLELTQATISNALHPLIADPPSTLKSFFQQRTASIFQDISTVTGILNMSTLSMLSPGISNAPALREEDVEVAQVALEDAVSQMLDVETVSCASLQMEKWVADRNFAFHRHGEFRSSGGMEKQEKKGELGNFTKREKAAQRLIIPEANYDEDGSLSLSPTVVSIEEWDHFFAPLFGKAAYVPVEIDARLTCMAERPNGTAPSFQQLVSQSNCNSGEVRISVSLSREVL